MVESSGRAMFPLRGFERGEDGSYTSGPYRLTPQVAGFGIETVNIEHDGVKVHRIAGHAAMQKAITWAEADVVTRAG